MKGFQHNLRNGRKDNVLNYFTKSSIRSKASKSPLEVLELTLQSFDNSADEIIIPLFCVVKQLDEVLLKWEPQKPVLFELFWVLKNEIQVTGRRELEIIGDSSKWLRNIILQHAAEVLKRFIMGFTVLPPKVARHYETEEILQLKGIALEIFHALCAEFENIAKPYAMQENLLNCLFSYMQYKETCFPACRSIECLLLSRKAVLDLSTIENLQEMVMGFEDMCLGNFCKILAITLSELDMYEHKTSLYAQTKQKKTQNFYVRDVNQDVILRVPNILPRLVHLACAKPFVPWFPTANFESEQWLMWIDDQLSQDIENEEEGNEDNFIGGLTTWSRFASRGRLQASVRITSELTFRADAVCVLGLLLVGRHRKEVQKELADLQLIPQLSDLFDHFIWRSSVFIGDMYFSRRDPARLPGHNSTCECSPEVALKIQVLRLIHSFCDHSDYKHVMLSWNEYSELQTIEGTASTPPVPLGLTRNVMCTGNKGLLSKIVEVMKRESGASTFRFWLSRAIESYLRGSLSNTDQDFLIRRNLLQHVVGNLISSNNRQKEVLQSSFDLLGELVKFNAAAFQEFDNQLHTVARKRKLLSLMNNSLIDSNMFIRSLILSYELFVSSDDIELKGFAEKFCFVLFYVSGVKTRVNYLHKLLSLINIQNLTQENVSCLNTALVILMFGLKKGELPQYLSTLAAIQEGCSVATTDYTGLLSNLKDLLLFWQDHYLQKDKDSTILERSSRICFQEWRDAVSLLTCEDTCNPSTLAFYIRPAISSRAS